MKIILSIIGAIGLTATSTTSLISCQKPNNNENGEGDNKPKPSYNPQQPPKDSNWKLIDRSYFENEIKKPNNKWYIGIIPYNEIYKIYKIKNNSEKNNSINRLFTKYDNVYRWDGDGERQTPTIDKNTGEIIDWK
ncbi:hypothetical protein C6B38_00945 [Spiroplasma sp. ChiS]|uniref:lipoprotein n=1 Tax=Spiroplasma sp. ChiS TaxID=2099885 RepID=UPI000CF8DFAE|nr:lipoprotein [Spiroplasma sp. ChiS]PQP79519.1 hypothetical protein C6B38_00945 [Spiroplasma sp. ChiS]